MTSPDGAAPGLRANDRLALFVNPAARLAREHVVVAGAARILARRYRVDVMTPDGPDAVGAAAREAAATHAGVVVAGGDGTLNRVINALSGIPIPIGLLPLGTGNDFARAMGIRTSTAAAERILDGRVRHLDLISVSGRLFATVGLLGVPSASALSVARLNAMGSRARPLMQMMGSASYRAVGLAHLVRGGGATERVTVSVAGQPSLDAAADVYGVFVANTRVLGGGLTLPLLSDPADGQMEIALIPAMSRARLLWAFTCFANGWRVPAGSLRVVCAAQARIACGRALPFSADGELLGEACRFELKVKRGALACLC